MIPRVSEILRNLLHWTGLVKAGGVEGRVHTTAAFGPDVVAARPNAAEQDGRYETDTLDDTRVCHRYAR
jgi:hypothetical protein